MRLGRVAFGQIPFEVKTTSIPTEFVVSFFRDGPNALSAMAALNKDKDMPLYVVSRSALTGGNSTDEREFTVTVTPNTELEKLKTYLTSLFEPIGKSVNSWWS